MLRRTITLEIKEFLAHIRLARPDVGNPIDSAFLSELTDAWEEINDSTEVRVAILSADGEVFSRGWSEGDAPARGTGPPFTCLEEGPPVICAINGDAVGAGLELALACDVRVAAAGARFVLPEIARGALPRGGGTQRLPRLVGQGEALRMILLGEEIDAREALRIGLVSAVFDADDLERQTEALGLRMASRGPIALRYAKEAVRRGLEQPLDQALRFETDLTVLLQTTDDRAEGVQAFLEKREARFKGR